MTPVGERLAAVHALPGSPISAITHDAQKVALQTKSLLGFFVRLEPKNIEQIGSELAIEWNDGSETFLPVRFLRTACPCAACGGEPDVMGEVVRPNVSYSDQSFELRSWNLVGGYALQPSWGDGHNTGIYSYQYLRRIDPARAA